MQAHAQRAEVGATNSVAALRAQVQELSEDVYEGMCALGIESNRVAALVDALASMGVDPNPILDAVENTHLESATFQLEAEISPGKAIAGRCAFEQTHAAVLPAELSQDRDLGSEHTSLFGSVGFLTGTSVWTDVESASARKSICVEQMGDVAVSTQTQCQALDANVKGGIGTYNSYKSRFCIPA